MQIITVVCQKQKWKFNDIVVQNLILDGLGA